MQHSYKNCCIFTAVILLCLLSVKLCVLFSFPIKSLDSIFLKRTATRAVLIPSVSLIFPAIT